MEKIKIFAPQFSSFLTWLFVFSYFGGLFHTHHQGQIGHILRVFYSLIYVKNQKTYFFKYFKMKNYLSNLSLNSQKSINTMHLTGAHF